MREVKSKINQTKKKLQRNKNLVENFSYLSFLQGFNLIIPLISYPYLIRVLGSETYGMVVFSLIISGYFGILIDFGFKNSATKNISVFRSDLPKVSEIVSSVLLIKFILWLLSFLILIILILIIPSMQENKLLFILSFGMCFNELLFPHWYFQGIEKMKYITIYNILARSLFLALIFILVRSESDYLMVPLCHGTGMLAGGILALYQVFTKHKIKLSIQPCSTLIFYAKESLPLFGSNLVISIKDRFSVIFIGAFLGMREVAIFDLGIKIMNLLIQPVEIINRTIYPRVSINEDKLLALKIAKYSFWASLILILIIQPFLPYIIDFLSQGMRDAILPIRILTLSPLIMAWSINFGINFLNASGNYKLAFRSILFTTISYLLLIVTGLITNLSNHLMFFIVVTPLTYLIELGYRYFLLMKNALL